MKSSIAVTLLLVPTLGAFAACFDYSGSTPVRDDADAEPTAAADDASASPDPSSSAAPLLTNADASPAGVVAPDAGNPCDSLSYRGATPGGVVCPGAGGCECMGGDICCMQKIDALTGACTALGACRTIALQCDGPEDCGGDGGVCCLEDCSGGGASCKAGASCVIGQWLCRGDGDCNGSPAGPFCTPLDLGAAGVDDVGLDGIVGVCGK